MLEVFNLPDYVAWIVIFIAGLYWYLTRNHGYWKTRGVPYVKPWPVVGSVILDIRTPAHDTDVERYKKYGRIYGHFEGNMPILTVGEPELLRCILLKDFHSFPIRRVVKVNDPIRENMIGFISGEQWKRVRSIISPTFSTGKLKRLLSIFNDCVETLSNNLLKAEKEGNAVNAKALFGAFTLDVIASSAFSTKLDSHNDPNNQFVQIAKLGFNNALDWKFILRSFAPALAKILKVGLVEGEMTNFFGKIALHIIEERQRTGQTRNDFLQLLLEASKEGEQEQEAPEGIDITAKYAKEGNDEQIIRNTGKKKPLSNVEILAQCVIFFLTGYETTGTTLSLCSYHLAKEPEVQDSLAAEIDESLRESEGKVTYEAIQKMKYMDNVISETLRMHPPLFRAQRIAAEDYPLGDTGITVPKGMRVEFPVHAIHHDPEFYPEPEKFDPDRFCDEEASKRPAFTYLPFGGGPRNCVAMRFALLEMKVCLARILSRFRFSIDPSMKVPLEFDFSTFLIRPKDILLRLKLRNDQRYSEP